MQRQNLLWVNLALGGTSLFFLSASALYLFSSSTSTPINPAVPEKIYSAPKNAFARPNSEYEAIRVPTLSLAYSTPTLQLPDLRQSISYFGKNGRPDAAGHHTLLHISLAGSPQIFSVTPNQPFYLQYDKNITPPRYTPSPNQQETSLWLTIQPQDHQATVNVSMHNEKGEIIHHPIPFTQFTVTEREFVRQPGKTAWELGKWRVDGSLLVRQRARWFGADRFLENHGGEEYSYTLGRERIEFGEKEDAYAIFATIGDTFIWENERWIPAQPGSDSLGKPLLVVKKIDERLMTFELWDIEGKGRVLLNLIKSTEPWVFQHLQNDFKYIGAKTRSEFVFNLRNERAVLSPQDWLLLTESGWKKLDTIEEIDAYVQRKLSGPLFILEGITKQGDHQILLATLYNRTRTESHTLELLLQQGSSPSLYKEGTKEHHIFAAADDDEDDDDDDDEEEAIALQEIKETR